MIAKKRPGQNSGPTGIASRGRELGRRQIILRSGFVKMVYRAGHQFMKDEQRRPGRLGLDGHQPDASVQIALRVRQQLVGP
jgi:hypothetical protein